MDEFLRWYFGVIRQRRIFSWINFSYRIQLKLTLLKCRCCLSLWRGYMSRRVMIQTFLNNFWRRLRNIMNGGHRHVNLIMMDLLWSYILGNRGWMLLRCMMKHWGYSTISLNWRSYISNLLSYKSATSIYIDGTKIRSLARKNIRPIKSSWIISSSRKWAWIRSTLMDGRYWLIWVMRWEMRRWESTVFDNTIIFLKDLFRCMMRAKIVIYLIF